MPAEAKQPDELAAIIRDNLERITANTRYPNATIAKVCDVTRGTVSHWFSKTNPRLPSIDCLMKIADYYGVMVDTLLTKSGEKYMHRRFNTYSDAFAILNDFVREGIIAPEAIHNKILKELCTMYSEAINSFSISDEEIGEWVKDIIARFCIPIPNKETMGDEIYYLDEITDLLYDSPGIRTMDKLQTLENLAKALSDKKTIKETMQAIQESEKIRKTDREIQRRLELHNREN